MKTISTRLQDVGLKPTSEQLANAVIDLNKVKINAAIVNNEIVIKTEDDTTYDEIFTLGVAIGVFLMEHK